ncbi:uncharacterized protein BO88DRAFT_274091 [Aspergillus vadensis CBS 113365]|uniref:Uncharacterized protein n=1 Tax=Aspergillus vadensis (strain CBS 113365 / IMI 142717 / IBT 24658) TaxID=1448311 RepID=A0A319BBJ1_ASPVC|nr:hypothetical protein BO88DRAFT_274091 [Aspergillus vadensis CBS 113365]PYH70055.1 hypothetical protein BO88DRAFT_274091 [Aspergillus vadensis CBS 113365]
MYAPRAASLFGGSDSCMYGWELIPQPYWESLDQDLLFNAPQSAQSRFFPYCFILIGTTSHRAMTRPVQCCPTSQLVRYASYCKNTRKLTEHMQWYVLLCKGFLTEDRSLKPPQLRGVSGNGSFLPRTQSQQGVSNESLLISEFQFCF